MLLARLGAPGNQVPINSIQFNLGNDAKLTTCNFSRPLKRAETGCCCEEMRKNLKALHESVSLEIAIVKYQLV